MLDGQIALFEIPDVPKATTPDEKQRRNWESGFQRWSNKMFVESPESYGACGYGSMCDHCTDNTYGRPCVRALNEMCREKRITIDYKKRNYEDIWDGEFENRK